MGFVDKLLGRTSEQQVKKLMPTVNKINSLEPQMQNLTDDKLTGYTNKFKERLAAGETMDDLLPEAFRRLSEGETLFAP